MKIPYGTYTIECTYLQAGKENTWKGIIRLKLEDGLSEKGNIYTIEGYNIDEADKNNKRYVFGPSGLNKVEETLIFCIFPSNMQPIEYRLKYDEEDDCFYGTWRFFIAGEKESGHQNYAKIVLNQSFEIGEQELEGLIESALDNARGQNYISEMQDDNKSTILADDLFPDDFYKNATKYFKGHSKTIGC